MSIRPSARSDSTRPAPMARTYAAVLAVEAVVVGLLWMLQQIFA